MSKGKKYKIPHKYLSKYPIRKSIKRDGYRVVGGKNGKAKFKFFRHKKLWKLLDGHISMRRMMTRYIWFWD